MAAEPASLWMRSQSSSRCAFSPPPASRESTTPPIRPSFAGSSARYERRSASSCACCASVNLATVARPDLVDRLHEGGGLERLADDGQRVQLLVLRDVGGLHAGGQEDHRSRDGLGN